MMSFFKSLTETESLKQELILVERERGVLVEELRRAQRELKNLKCRDEKPGDYCRVCRNALNNEAASEVFIQSCECALLIPCPHFKLKE